MRGGTKLKRETLELQEGLSPHARGNLVPRDLGKTARGSIPACAGEPLTTARQPCCPGVYPRMRGGTPFSSKVSANETGLSPHARGNLAYAGDWGSPRGSIPACAGEPAVAGLAAGSLGVYPRMRGGTGTLQDTEIDIKGLSPHARGNRAGALVQVAQHGSIPACAGEPSGHHRATRTHRAYPRMRGGTLWGGWCRRFTWGLSPHARGNLSASNAWGSGLGSIPACAGEPLPHTPRLLVPRVYPRMRGGTWLVVGAVVTALGLSPHARGNRCCRTPEKLPSGSIPACAGEPYTFEAGQ